MEETANELQRKLDIIIRLQDTHPASAVDKGWSWYTGGMADTGGWYQEKMMAASIDELATALRASYNSSILSKIRSNNEASRITEKHTIFNNILRQLLIKELPPLAELYAQIGKERIPTRKENMDAMKRFMMERERKMWYG